MYRGEAGAARSGWLFLVVGRRRLEFLLDQSVSQSVRKSVNQSSRQSGSQGVMAWQSILAVLVPSECGTDKNMAHTRQSSEYGTYRTVERIWHISDSRANMAHIRQSRPDPGLGFQVKVLKPFEVAPSSR